MNCNQETCLIFILILEFLMYSNRKGSPCCENCSSRSPTSASLLPVNIRGMPANNQQNAFRVSLIFGVMVCGRWFFCLAPYKSVTVSCHQVRTIAYFISKMGLPWKHSLASPAIRTTSPLRRNIANGGSSLHFPPKRKIALQPILGRGSKNIY